jgi:Domain of unknown function (DUF4124)
MLASLVASALTFPAAAQLYKWTDETGTTNYGNKPPANARNVQKLDESKSRVSTVPGLKPEEIQAEQNRALQQKADSLERDAAAQRRETAGAQSSVASDAQWRERCLADRRVDCDDPSRGTFDYGLDPTGYPYYPTRPPRPPVAPPINPPVRPVQPGLPRPTPR